MKENENVLIEIEECLLNIFDEDLNISMKELFGISPVELVSLIIEMEKEKTRI